MAHVTVRHNKGEIASDVNLELWPRQEQVRSCEANEIFFGGAAGPGKSHLLRVLCIQYPTEIPHLQVYLFRRQFVDIAPNHIDGKTGFRAMLNPWIENGFVELTESEARWWNGSKVHFCHFQEWKDRNKYYGPEMNVVCVDELTHLEERMYRFLRGRNRLGGLEEQMREQIAKGEIPEWYLDQLDESGNIIRQGKFPLMVSASNPGNIGHAWVKRTFIDSAPPDVIHQTEKSEGNRTRVFFPATLDDNPSIDRRYEDNLEGLGDSTLVRAMRYGDWDIVMGGFFESFSRIEHVIKPFSIPRHWPVLLSMDWGWYFPFSVGWIAYVTESYEDRLYGNYIPAGSIILYKEWYGSSGKDKGVKLTPAEVAAGIRERHGNDPEPYSYVADKRLWKTDTGESPGDKFLEAGIYWEKASGSPGDRIEGWRNLDARLIAKPAPLLYIFENCIDTISQFGLAVRDESNPEDIDKGCETHGLDMIRYGEMFLSKGLPAGITSRTVRTDDGLTFDDFWKSHLKAKKMQMNRGSSI